MLKYLVGIRRGFSKAYNVSNIFRRHGRLKYSVNGMDRNYRPFIMPVTWLSFIASLQVTSVKDLGDTEKILSVKEATENLITEADDLFSENKYKELYELLYPYKESNDVEILWRLSRALHHMSKQQCHNEEKKRYVFEGYDLIVKALQLNDSHYAVHKWYAIFLDTRAAYDGIKARVTQLPNVKNHLLQAVELNPKDATTLYILGYWCYNISSMPWYQRKIASAIFATPPTSSFEEALVYFCKAEEVDPNFYRESNPTGSAVPAIDTTK
ncbi:regulator of microtubule dynamics protein 1 isoform X6 [Cryptotermes secundus]|uniref:regulator of microtubule dynamics protein 1 isoform X6 n=1 Tax=Cryptotermes secundus TaxID=105785 RepID=UPI000CD7D852|nr:regulator of microtubule dynamics protein 1 isoform X6 [Cryptotermes secundus]